MVFLTMLLGDSESFLLTKCSDSVYLLPLQRGLFSLKIDGTLELHNPRECDALH